MFDAWMLVTVAVAVGAALPSVAVLTNERVEVPFEIDVGNGTIDGLPLVASEVWTDPEVPPVTGAVAVCTADVVREVNELSGTLAVFVRVSVELSVAVDVVVPFRKDVVDDAATDVTTVPLLEVEDVVDVAAADVAVDPLLEVEDVVDVAAADVAIDPLLGVEDGVEVADCISLALDELGRSVEVALQKSTEVGS